MEIKEQLEHLTIEQILLVIQYMQNLNAHNPQKEIGRCA